MIHLPGACPDVPDDLVINSETFGPNHNYGETFKAQYRPIDSDGACRDHFWIWGKHAGVGDHWETHYEGHGVIMMRQPEQRIMSGYTFGAHSWPWRSSPPRSALEYANTVQGCAVRMLKRGGETPDVTCGGKFSGPPTRAEVELARQRLRMGFVFVGLTDQWPLSMCLGHRILGGHCRTSDFVDGRVTERNEATREVLATPKIRLRPSLYDTSSLQGFRDPYDGPLYETAVKVFERELERYDVSLESCQPFFEEAGIRIEP